MSRTKKVSFLDTGACINTPSGQPLRMFVRLEYLYFNAQALNDAMGETLDPDLSRFWDGHTPISRLPRVIWRNNLAANSAWASAVNRAAERVLADLESAAVNLLRRESAAAQKEYELYRDGPRSEMVVAAILKELHPDDTPGLRHRSYQTTQAWLKDPAAIQWYGKAVADAFVSGKRDFRELPAVCQHLPRSRQLAVTAEEEARVLAARGAKVAA